MSQKASVVRHRRRPSLTVRVSAWLMVATIAPLIITVICSELLARPALIAQYYDAKRCENSRAID